MLQCGCSRQNKTYGRAPQTSPNSRQGLTLPLLLLAMLVHLNLEMKRAGKQTILTLYKQRKKQNVMTHFVYVTVIRNVFVTVSLAVQVTLTYQHVCAHLCKTTAEEGRRDNKTWCLHVDRLTCQYVESKDPDQCRAVGKQQDHKSNIKLTV